MIPSHHEKAKRNGFADGLLGKESNSRQYDHWPDKEKYLAAYLAGQEERFQPKQKDQAT